MVVSGVLNLLVSLNPYFLGSLSIEVPEEDEETIEWSKSLFSWKPIYRYALQEEWYHGYV